MPVQPQRLAFATDRRVGLVEDRQIRYLGASKGGGQIRELAWSGDGRRLAWLNASESIEGPEPSLTMMDLQSGARRSWTVGYGPIVSGTTGVVMGGYESRFTQYMPDGTREEQEVRISPPPDPDRTEPPSTSVIGAVPAEGAWLIAAENNDRLLMPAASYRIFRFDPARPRLIPLGSVPQGGWQLPTRLDDDHVVWIDEQLEAYCRHDDRLGGYRVRLPALPKRRDGRTWRIRNLIEIEGRVSVLARGNGAPFPVGDDYSEDCIRGDGSYRWLELRDGEWVERRSGLVELDLADDGRIAAVNGEVCFPSEYGPDCEGAREGEFESRRYRRARIEYPSDPSLPLPAGTRLISFSPSLPISIRRDVGRGSELSSKLTLAADGLGALRLGATPEEMRAATRSVLRFDIDHGGCGTVTLADAAAARELGVRGSIVDSHLVAITLSTLDRPVDETHPPLSELQPDVSSVRARGPRTDRGVRAGDHADRLLARYGTPQETSVERATETTEYVYELDGSTLTATVDGSATVRRLVLSSGPHEGSCRG